MGKLSKEKGKRGEREVANLLVDYGFKARRGQQFSGGTDSPDVVHSIPYVHIEVKRSETFSPEAAMRQARGDAKPEDMPAVFHRKNSGRWLVVLDAEDFLNLMRDYTNGKLYDDGK